MLLSLDTICVVEDEKYKCKVCNSLLSKRPDNIIRHFKLKHPVEFSEIQGKQINIASSIVTREEYIDELMGLIARLNLSFNFWNDPGVRNLFSGYAEKFKVPCSSDSMTALLKPYAQGVRDRLKLELKDKLLCLKFDIASRRHRSFIGISVQFINNWKIEVRALKMATIRGKTDSISLQVLIEDCLRDFGVDKRQIYTVTTDNGANVLKTSKLLLMASTQLEWDDEEEEEEPVNSLPIFFDFDENDENQEIYLEDFDLPEETPEAPLNIDEEEDDATEIIHAIQSSIGNYGDLETRCAAHVVQLAVHDIMNTERKTLIRVTKKKVGAVIKYIRTMPDDDNRPSLPKYPTDTRWNSTYYMVRIDYLSSVYM